MMTKIGTIFRHQKRKFNIKSSDTRWYVGQTVASFTGMIIALSWNDLLQNFIDVIKEDFPLLSIFGGFFVAVILTLIAIMMGILFLNSIGNNDKKIENLIDASKHWKVFFYNRTGDEKRKTRYFTVNDLRQYIIDQFNILDVHATEDQIEMRGEDEFHGYTLKMIPIHKNEYEENSKVPLPLFETQNLTQ